MPYEIDSNDPGPCFYAPQCTEPGNGRLLCDLHIRYNAYLADAIPASAALVMAWKGDEFLAAYNRGKFIDRMRARHRAYIDGTGSLPVYQSVVTMADLPPDPHLDYVPANILAAIANGATIALAGDTKSTPTTHIVIVPELFAVSARLNGEAVGGVA